MNTFKFFTVNVNILFSFHPKNEKRKEEKQEVAWKRRQKEEEVK